MKQAENNGLFSRHRCSISSFILYVARPPLKHTSTNRRKLLRVSISQHGPQTPWLGAQNKPRRGSTGRVFSDVSTGWSMPRGVASLQKSVSISLPQIVGFFPWRPHHRSLKRLPPWMGGLAYFFCCSALIWPESSRRDRKSLNEQKCSERLQSNCKQKKPHQGKYIPMLAAIQCTVGVLSEYICNVVQLPAVEDQESARSTTAARSAHQHFQN